MEEKNNNKDKNIENQVQVNIPEFYVNATLTNFSPYEFEITLGLNGSQFKGPRPVSTVRMSPQFAKEFSRILNNNISLYEQKFGEIMVLEANKNNQSLQ